MKRSCPLTHIIKRDGAVVRYDRTRIANAIAKAMVSAGTPNPALAETMARRVEEALVETYGATLMPSVEDIQDVVENVLMEHRLTPVARRYIIYRHEHAMARAARAYAFEVTDNVPYKVIYDVLRWNMEHGCESVPALNRIIACGGFSGLVAEADQRYEKDLDRVADRILERQDQVRLVVVAGPSSSGKTTTTLKLGERLARAGLRFRTLNADHYFFDLSQHPRDEFGDYDYETPQALDLDLLNQHLMALLEGKRVRTPYYDFKSGLRNVNVQPMRLRKGELLLLDSLHGLFEATTASVPAAYKFRIYIETLGQFRAEDGTFMRWADNRLLRRMVRDRDHRNLKPLETLTHWHYVRKSELKHIIPYIKHADVIINSALPYELPILKHRLFPYITRATHAYRDDPKRLDAHIRANRVYALLKPLRAIRDDACVPANSLLREFIGGSSYTY